MSGVVCASCRFWCPPPEGSPNPMGQCRRHPPTAFMVLVPASNLSRLAPGGQQQQQVTPMFPSAWPPAPADGWCGEYGPISVESGQGA